MTWNISTAQLVGPVISLETKIDITGGSLVVQVNLDNGKVHCYGTLQLAQEMSSRYFLTKEIQAAKAAQESKSRLKVIMPDGANV